MRSFHLLLAMYLLAAFPLKAQDNPLQMLFPDTRMVVERPEGLDVRHDTVTLKIGLETDDGQEVSHTASLPYLKAKDSEMFRVYGIKSADLEEFLNVIEQMEEWKAQDIRGSAIFSLDFNICQTAPADNEAFFVLGMFVEHLDDSLLRFGQVNVSEFETDLSDPDGNDIKTCADVQ